MVSDQKSKPSASGVHATGDDVPREKTFEILAQEAGAFYRSILTVATAFLGGSLVFLDKTAATFSTLSLCVLAMAWGALVWTIALIVRVRRDNLVSGRLALQDMLDEAKRLDEQNEDRTNLAVTALIVGISLMMFFGMLSLKL